MNDMSAFHHAQAFHVRPSFSFILLPRFSLLALAGAIEPLRHANNVLGQSHYSWALFSESGEACASSSSIPVMPSGKLNDVSLTSNIVLVGGADIISYSSPGMLNWLRYAALRAPLVGGLCTATRVLAEAGLLDDHRATIHWEMADSMKEAYPDVEISDRLFEIDNKRITCAGEAASTDMMLHLISDLHGQDVAALVAAQVLHGRIRSPVEPQAPLSIRTGNRNKFLLRAVSLMESHQDEILDIEEIASRTGCSRRHLERLFSVETGLPPITYYRNLRLDRARHLLFETELSHIEIAMACGFESCSTFNMAYKRRFGLSPSAEKKSRHRRSVAAGGDCAGSINN